MAAVIYCCLTLICTGLYRQGSASRTTSGPGARDAVFIHAYVSYQLLARRIQRDLLIADGLVQPAPPAPGTKAPGTLTQKQPQQADPRVYPAVIKTLDTVLQSLDQMRTLSITDESPDIASALDVRISFTKAKRCVSLVTMPLLSCDD